MLLVDDVGLGKTTVAAICALVFAGSEKRVRILAPNEMMARRWRQELEIHIEAVSKFATHLELNTAKRRLGQDVKIKNLTAGAVAVSTHLKAGQLACDLLIVDEAHRTRSEQSNLVQRLNKGTRTIDRVLILTATPFSIDPEDLARPLARIGGRSAEKAMREYAEMLKDLWGGRGLGSPKDTAQKLVEAAKAAVKAMKPFVIRHGIDDNERLAFGNVDNHDDTPASLVPDNLLEAMLRTDRALDLGGACGAWQKKRRNDPRYHVSSGKLDTDLTDLLNRAACLTDGNAAVLRRHGEIAQKLVRPNGTHPKIAETVATARRFVEQGEKVLIFCDHHFPAVELTKELALALRWPGNKAQGPGTKIWNFRLVFGLLGYSQEGRGRRWTQAFRRTTSELSCLAKFRWSALADRELAGRAT